MKVHFFLMTTATIFIAIIIFFTVQASAREYNIRDFGAKGDFKQNDRVAIQKAIDACANAGGGEVYFPAGEYLSGSVEVKDRVTLFLSVGATLYASTNPADYPPSNRGGLLVANGATQIAIAGRGTIHGQGQADYGERWGVPEKPDFRTGILLFEDCSNVSIRDVTILYSDSWTLHLRRCDNVTVDGVTIFNNVRRLNSDGIDPNSCKNVRISNCHIVAGDDCIVLKNTQPYSCENVVVTNCTLETTTTALKLGTESQGDFRDIHFSNCTIRNTRTGIGFFMKDGATMERVSFSNISIETFEEKPYPMDVFPIFMDIEKRHADTPVGRIRDVTFRDISIRSGSGILCQGMPESRIENLTLDNIQFRVDWFDDFENRKKAVGGSRTYRDDRDRRFAKIPSYLTFAYIKGLFIDNVRLTFAKEFENGLALSGFGLQDGSIENVSFDMPNRTHEDLPIDIQESKNIRLQVKK